MKKYITKNSIICILILFHSCTIKKDLIDGGYEYIDTISFYSAPGMITINGGIIETLDEKKQIINKKVRMFELSMYEETNGQYMVYLDYIKRYYSYSTYLQAIPDTLIWYKENLPDTICEFLSKNYLRHPDFVSYPVVGVNPMQIEKYCIWKTNRLNEMILISEGIRTREYFEIKDSNDVFLIDSFVIESYITFSKDSFDIKDYPIERLRMESGLLYPNYRIPTSDEWLLAAQQIKYERHQYPLPDKEDKDYKNSNLFCTPNFFPLMTDNPRAKKFFHKANLNLHPVFNTSKNSQHLFGIDSNIGEITGNSNGYFIAFGTWTEILNNNYCKKDKKESHISASQLHKILQLYSTKACGFRLAMSRNNWTEFINPNQ